MALTKIKPKLEYIGADMIDQYQCICGWKTCSYFDGAEYALKEWENHCFKNCKDFYEMMPSECNHD